MKIGFFTDTYFPQVSGVATSIKTLTDELKKNGHKVYIFTTTDPNAKELEEDVIRMPSVPFISFKDRRIVVRGMWYAYNISKELELDIIHTHTEFGAGLLGKLVGKKLRIPVIHTYHTMYEDYLHYIAKGKVLRPIHVKYFSRIFANHTTGVVCPSQRVIEKLKGYGVTTPMRVIPTGIHIEEFIRTDITKEMSEQLRKQLNLTKDAIFLLSLSRISYEKNIQAIFKGMPKIIEAFPQIQLIVVGKGPYMDDLKQLATELQITENIKFTGEIPHEEIAIYYRTADYFVNASTSESQGLTYLEAIASGTQCVVEGNSYLDMLFNDNSLGVTFETDDDFASTLIHYINSNIKMDKHIWQDKLHEISAAHFGKQMLKFYYDMLDYHRQLLIEKKNSPSIEKIKVKLTSLRK